MKTKKKMKVVGGVEYINKETGELEIMQTVKMEDRDFNFDKIWMLHVLDSLDAIGNQKIKVMNALIKLKDTHNQIVTTQRALGKFAGVSLPVVNQTLQILVDSDFIRKKQNGVYMINPNFLFKGTRSNRMNVLLQYEKQEEIKISDNPETHVLINKNLPDEAQGEIQLE